MCMQKSCMCRAVGLCRVLCGEDPVEQRGKAAAQLQIPGGAPEERAGVTDGASGVNKQPESSNFTFFFFFQRFGIKKGIDLHFGFSTCLQK